ncbi:hypothetical protein [Ornithinibacillus salinisoli]
MVYSTSDFGISDSRFSTGGSTGVCGPPTSGMSDKGVTILNNSPVMHT